MSTETQPLVDLRRLAARTATAFALFVDLAIIFGASRAPLSNADTYFHLRFGEEFLHRWSIASPGQPSAVSTARWVPTQWLTEMAWAWIDDHFGRAGLSILYAALITAFLIAAYLAARTVAAPGPALAVATVDLAASLHWMGLRPQLVSFVLIAVTVAAWQRARDLRATPWWLIPMTWMWAMCHGMWVIGVAIGVTAAVGIALEGRDIRGLVRHLAIPALSLGAAMVTPVGPRLILAVLEVGSRSADFAEWAPIPLLHGWGLPVTAVIGIITAARMVRGGSSPYSLVMLALAAGLAVYSGRTVVAALLVATPLLAAELRATARGASRRREAVVLCGAAAAGLFTGVLAAPLAGPGLAEDLAPYTAELDALPAGAVVLTDRVYGSVLLKEQPRLQLPIQGYGDVFTDDELRRYDGVTHLDPGWITTVRELHACVALLDPRSALAYALTEHGWQVTVSGEDLEMLVARSATCGNLGG